jgi:anaerobic selenocysteine-containing dehydrogenase
MSSAEPSLELSVPIADRVETTTCYMCACRCGIRVHLKNGRIRYIDGNPDHPKNRGVICGKGAAGAMKQASPAKLRKPLKRVGPRGSGEMREIEWDEALALATGWLGDIRRSDPRKLAFFTGRDQSQALTGWWAQAFGTPNHAAHGGFCSVNMAAAGLYSIGGSFWEFGEPDWERARLLVMFGVAEDHDSNPIKIGLAKLKARGARVVSVNPVRTGYSAIADAWIGLRPGTDGLLIGAIIRELLIADRIDIDFLRRYTNAAWLVIDDPGAADHGLIARDPGGAPMKAPALVGRYPLADGRRGVPAFELFARRFLGEAYAADEVAGPTGVPADEIRALAADIARAAFDHADDLPLAWVDAEGHRHASVKARPVAFHAMRGISAHSNGFQTCRMLHALQMLIGAIDRPGSWRYKPPFPRAVPGLPRPGGRLGEVAPGQALVGGPPLGAPRGPEDLLVDAQGRALRIDKAFSWEAPLAIHGALHAVIDNAFAGDPYPIDTLFLFMANMSWNSALNPKDSIAKLEAQRPDGAYVIPRIIYVDAFWSEMVPYADLVLPDTTYLERHDCISLLDRPISDADGAADAMRHPVVEPDRDVRPFQSVLLDLGQRLGLPGMVDAAGGPLYPGGYADYLVRHERKPGIGPLAGWRGERGDRAGRGAPNPGQLDAYRANGDFWRAEIPEAARFHRYANRAYLEWATALGLIDAPTPATLELYVETLQKFRLAAEGHGRAQPPDADRARIKTYFDPLPFWYPPFEDEAAEGYALHAVTQRPMIMYHSWDSQNAWQRQILARNRLYVPRALGERLGLGDDDWAVVESRKDRLVVRAKLMEGLNGSTVWTWNAVGKRAGAWALAPAAPEFAEAFLLNHLIDAQAPQGGGTSSRANADPITGQAAWYDLRVRLRKANATEIAARDVAAPTRQAVLPAAPTLRRGGAVFRKGATP